MYCIRTIVISVNININLAKVNMKFISVKYNEDIRMVRIIVLVT